MGTKTTEFGLRQSRWFEKAADNELEELRNDAYDNARISKHRAKIFHDKSIHRKIFVSGQKVLLYNTRLHLFPGKLKTRWSDPYVVQNVSPYGAIEIFDPKNGSTFKVNGQRLKPFFTTESESHNVIELGLCDPVYMWPRNSTPFPDVSCKSFWNLLCKEKKRIKKEKGVEGKMKTLGDI